MLGFGRGKPRKHVAIATLPIHCAYDHEPALGTFQWVDGQVDALCAEHCRVLARMLAEHTMLTTLAVN